MHAKCTIPRQKIKKFSGRGLRPLPHWGGGHPLPKPHSLRRLRARPWPPNKSPGSASAARYTLYYKSINTVNLQSSFFDRCEIFGRSTRSAPSAKTLASAKHCKGMFGAPLIYTTIRQWWPCNIYTTSRQWPCNIYATIINSTKTTYVISSSSSTVRKKSYFLNFANWYHLLHIY